MPGDRVKAGPGATLRYLLLGFLLASAAATAAAAVARTAGAVVFAVALAVSAWRAARTGIAVNDHGLVITGFWRDRSFPWSDIRTLSWSRPGEGAVTGVVPVNARMRLILRSGDDHLLPLWSTGSRSQRVEAQFRDYALRHDVPVDALLRR